LFVPCCRVEIHCSSSPELLLIKDIKYRLTNKSPTKLFAVPLVGAQAAAAQGLAEHPRAAEKSQTSFTFFLFL
jgi:hypothetical protein